MANTTYIGGAVIADTVYLNGVLVGRDVEITLPAVEYATIDLAAMGTYSKPIPQLIEHMEASFGKIDPGLWCENVNGAGENNIECRWAQDITTPNGGTRTIGLKAFLRGESANIPEIGVVVGEASEPQNNVGLSKYAVFRDGKELFYIDRWAGVNRVGGKDLNAAINRFL